MLVPAMKLMIRADNIMVAKLATTPSLKLIIARCVCLLFHFINQHFPVRDEMLYKLIGAIDEVGCKARDIQTLYAAINIS
jgi:hypothetical protein